MKNKDFNIFKIEYHWYEGEYSGTFVGKNVDKTDFEKDLIKAKKFAQNLVGKGKKKGGYSVDCLPEYYSTIIFYLIDKLKYIKCYIDNELSYNIDDDFDKKIEVTRHEKKIETEKLK